LEKFKNTTFEPTDLKILSIDDRLLEANGYCRKQERKSVFFYLRSSKVDLGINETTLPW
jgi:hypothetical protein